MRRKSKLKQKKLIISIISALILIICLIFAPDVVTDLFSEDDKDIRFIDYPFCVSFIDVGQGDCELISCNGINILVDGGEAEYADDVLKYLKDNDIESIDCYVLTHPYSDHIGAAATILKAVECDKVFTTYFSEFNIPTSVM